MTVAEQVRILCVRINISEAELARRLGTSPQSLNAKIKRDTFSVYDMERIAEVTGTTFKREFILNNGETV